MRWRALAGVIVLLALCASGPAAAPRAQAEPRSVVVTTHILPPFVMQQGGRFSGFTVDL
jgi:ABC-type amino acid transport substrate-binding protein